MNNLQDDIQEKLWNEYKLKFSLVDDTYKPIYLAGFEQGKQTTLMMIIDIRRALGLNDKSKAGRPKQKR